VWLGNDNGEDVVLGDREDDKKLNAFIVNRTSSSKIYFNCSGEGDPIN
jgi:hypothetical protein